MKGIIKLSCGYRYFMAACVIALIAFASPAFCQGAGPGPIPQNSTAVPEKAPDSELQKRALRVQVSEVSAPVTVRNRAGEMVLDLTQKDFHVYDNGVEQKIQHFDLGGDKLSFVFVIETSSRIEALLPAIRKSGIVVAQAVVGPMAQAAVVGFDDTVDLLQNFTTSPDEIQSAIENLREGTSGAKLYDAMSRGISLLEEQPPNCVRTMVVIAESVDAGSTDKLGEVLRKAQLANVTIYSVGLSTTAAELRAPPSQYQPPQVAPPGTYPSPTINGQPQTPELEQLTQGNMDLMALAKLLVMTGKNAIGPNSLETASKATGGLHVNTRKDVSIQNALDKIGGQIHAQYTITYHPAGEEVSGYHDIKVQVDRPKVSVQTRPGYYIPPAS